MSPIITSPLIITPGEPAGIGAEITLKAWQAGMRDICLIGNPDHLGQTAESLGIDVNFYEIVNPSSYSFDPSALAIIPISWKKKTSSWSSGLRKRANGYRGHSSSRVLEPVRHCFRTCNKPDPKI